MRRVLGSVRARATLAASAVVAIALAAAGAAVLLSLWSNLSGQAGTQAERTAREVASRLAAERTYTNLSLDDEEPVQVVDSGGRLVAVTEDLERISGSGVDRVTPQAPAGTSGDDDDDKADEDEDSLEAGEIGDASSSSGSATIDGETADYRFATVPVEIDGQGTFTVHAGAPLTAEQEAVSTALTVMLIGFPLLLALVALVTWLVTRRALRPVEGIRGEMAAITASEDLTRRVPVPDTHDEIARLARTTNETLAALEESVERQRRFVADASHELRSPIASLRTQLEVGVAHPELLDVDGAVEDTVRLQRLAADLLLLARLDAGERVADTRLDLSALVREEASQRVGDRVAVCVDTESVDAGPVDAEPVQVAGSRGQLARVLGNLLDNAQRHTRSSVVVTVRRAGEWAVLGVADDGAGVPAAERDRVFERFVRLDESRTRDDGGAGLGLAIARDVAVRHGGSLTVRETPTGGALFELRLPLA
ncbi:HAMP domain-containing sensor histidine kinase [Streptomyces sp. NBC_00878]|uniref:sensor histidine kinase n=1 Tax=Streptomyces sp. NBC_00878 TaxID=2975854 RepID=UPI00224DCD7E|nr:HAMP domain-containing sensor histidine kinase [Streptomyces sp. NBC_00878]MCX4905317.1 HAMP domain-containing histidine kinase [Streptomyces sp. NBC_00878]